MAERMEQLPVYRVYWKSASGKTGYTAIPKHQAKNASEAVKLWHRDYQDTGQTFVRVEQKKGVDRVGREIRAMRNPQLADSRQKRIERITRKVRAGERLTAAEREYAMQEFPTWYKKNAK